MKLHLTFVFAIAVLFLSSCGAVNPWTRNKKDSSKKGSFDDVVDNYQEAPVGDGVGSPDLTLLNDQVTAVLDSLKNATPEDLAQVLTEVVDGIVKALGDKEVRKQYASQDVLKELLRSMPADALASPQMQGILSEFGGDASTLDKMDEKLFAKKMNETMDKTLSMAKEVQLYLKNSAKIPSFVPASLEEAGITGAAQKEFLNVLKDPTFITDTMATFLADMDSGVEGLKSLNSLMGLGSPEALSTNMADLLNDPALKAAMEDPAVAKMLEEMMQDPSKLEELLGSMGSMLEDLEDEPALASSRKRRTAADQQQRPARRQA